MTREWNERIGIDISALDFRDTPMLKAIFPCAACSCYSYIPLRYSEVGKVGKLQKDSES